MMTSVCSRVVLALWILLLILQIPSSAAWQEEGVPVCVAEEWQRGHQAVSDVAGGVFIAWEDKRADAGDIYAQRISGGGDALWASDGVCVCNAANWQAYVRIAVDAAGNLYLVWTDERDASSGHVYAQKLDPGGQPLWGSNGTPVSVEWSSVTPDITTDGSGGALVCWSRDRNIYAQHLDASGGMLWSAEGESLGVAPERQYAPRIVLDTQGGAIVAWYDSRQEVSETVYDIFAQRVTGAGVVLWGESGIPVCTAPENQKDPLIIPDGYGGAIVVWTDWRNGPSDLYAQRISPEGAMLWDVDGVSVCSDPDVQEDPQLDTDGEGGAIFVWKDERDDYEGEVYAQRILADGSMGWTPDGIDVCDYIGGSQHMPDVVADGVGGAVIAWYDRREDVSGDIFAQRLNADGTLRWSSLAVPVCMQEDAQHDVVLAADMHQGALLAWYDTRNAETSRDIYCSRVNAWGFVPFAGAAPEFLDRTHLAPQIDGVWPQPLVDHVWISFRHAQAEDLTLAVFDVAGRRVRQLYAGPSDGCGQVVGWSGHGDENRRVCAGQYYIVLRSAHGSARHRVVVAR